MNIKNELKKEFELRYLKLFSKTDIGIQYLSCLKVINLNSEEPDFLFRNILTHEIIGIEMVKIIAESEKQKSTSKLNQIVRNVCLKLDKHTNVKYCIFLSCNDGNYDNIPIHASEWVNKIFQIIIEDKNLKNGENKKFDFKLNNGDVLHLVYSINESSYHFPGVPDGGIVILNPFDLLENIIKKKNEKYTKYLKKCDKCSLIIVSDNMAGHSSFIEFNKSLEEHKFNSKFDNVFLYEFGGKIHSNTRKLNTYFN